METKKKKKKTEIVEWRNNKEEHVYILFIFNLTADLRYNTINNNKSNQMDIKWITVKFAFSSIFSVLVKQSVKFSLDMMYI